MLSPHWRPVGNTLPEEVHDIEINPKLVAFSNKVLYISNIRRC